MERETEGEEIVGYESERGREREMGSAAEVIRLICKSLSSQIWLPFVRPFVCLFVFFQEQKNV